MKKLFISLMPILFTLSMLTSCRPPELEGAYVDYKAGRIDQALVLAKKAVEKYPTNSEAWYLLGEIEGKKDHYAEMVKAFDKSLEVDNQYAKQIEQNHLYYFQTIFNKAVSSYNKFSKIEDRKSEEAVKTLNKAIEYFEYSLLLEKDYRAYNLIALSYVMMDNKEEALKAYTTLTEFKPDTADAWVALGNFHFVNQEYDKSIESLEKSMKIDPGNTEAIAILSQAYDLTGDQENAIKLYNKAKELSPEEKAFSFNLGLLYFKMATKEGVEENTKNDYLNKCVENFSETIALDPEMKDASDIKVNAEIQLGKYDEALNTLNSALEYFPEEGSFWFNLGVVHSRMQNVDEAKKAFKKAEDLGYK